jgi:hypothetical protein
MPLPCLSELTSCGIRPDQTTIEKPKNTALDIESIYKIHTSKTITAVRSMIDANISVAPRM